MQKSLVDYLKQQASDTDIFCFQEATDNMKHACAAALSDYREISDYKYISEHENFPQSIFVRKNIAILSSGTLMDHDMDRGLAVYAKVIVEGSELYICNAHGKSRPVEKQDDAGRLAFSQGLINFFGDKDVPVVIGGDFNLLPETESIKMFERNGYRDLIKGFAIDTTRNHLVWDRYPVKMHYSDYAFLNNKVQLVDFNVPKNEVSDHLPLVLTISLSAQSKQRPVYANPDTKKDELTPSLS